MIHIMSPNYSHVVFRSALKWTALSEDSCHAGNCTNLQQLEMTNKSKSKHLKCQLGPQVNQEM